MKMTEKAKKAVWLCAIENQKKGVAYIFTNVYFSMDYKNMRYWKNGLELRIFMSWPQLEMTTT